MGILEMGARASVGVLVAVVVLQAACGGAAGDSATEPIAAQPTSAPPLATSTATPAHDPTPPPAATPSMTPAPTAAATPHATPAPTPTPTPVPTPSKLSCPALPAEFNRPGAPPARPVFAWQTNWQSCEVSFISAMHGTRLYGVLFAPANVDFSSTQLPAVVITPASAGSEQSMYHWAARDLAGRGYLALTVDPQGVGRSPGNAPPQDLNNYADATVSGLDFLVSTHNPIQATVDAQRLGAAGHSLSARAVSWQQGEDRRLRAIVAWDNLSSTRHGDPGTASQGGASGALISGELLRPNASVVPLVPAMGQASDDPGSANSAPDPERKKFAFHHWRDAGIGSMQVVFRDMPHEAWGQLSTQNSEADSLRLRRFAYLTRSWFDLWLRDDVSAIDRLRGTRLLGADIAGVYSRKFRSALYLPQVGIDCADLVSEPCGPQEPGR
jgi:dienelactone hydrolase